MVQKNIYYILVVGFVPRELKISPSAISTFALKRIYENEHATTEVNANDDSEFLS